MGRLAMDSAGNLYGTTQFGGAFGFGTVYELVRSGSGWTFNLLHGFQGGSDGGYPLSGVVVDSAGNIYGANDFGGQNHGGVVYELSPSGGGWTFSIIFNPRSTIDGGMSIDSAGNLYAATYSGGNHQDGLVLELSPSGDTWTETDLYSFGGVDGALPSSTVSFDASGNLYGTTTAGGNHGYGVVWQIMR